MQYAVKLDEGVKTLEEQAKRLGIDEPLKVYFHRDSALGRCCLTWEALQKHYSQYSPCKCDNCIGDTK